MRDDSNHALRVPHSSGRRRRARRGTVHGGDNVQLLGPFPRPSPRSAPSRMYIASHGLNTKPSPPRPPNRPPPGTIPFKAPLARRLRQQQQQQHGPPSRSSSRIGTGPAHDRAQRATARRARQEIRPASVVRPRRARVLRALLQPLRYAGAGPARGRTRGRHRADRRECELVERAASARKWRVGPVARDVRRATLRAGCRSARCDRCVW